MANLEEHLQGVGYVPTSLSQQQAPRFQEKIRRATKRHELVEVDDFVFRRKRRAVAPSPAAAQVVAAAAAALPQAAPCNIPAAAIKHGLQLDGQNFRAEEARREDDAALADQEGQTTAADDTAAAAAGVEEPGPADTATEAAAAPAPEQDQQQQDAAAAADETLAAEAPVAAAEATPDEPTEPAPLQFTVAPSELCDLVEWVFFNERKKLPGTTADAARTAAAQFKDQFAELLQQHIAAKAEAQQADGAGTAAALQLTVLPYLLEQQKSALQDKREKLLQEEAHWLQLQQQYNELSTNTAGEAAGASTPAASEETAAAAEPADAADAPQLDTRAEPSCSTAAAAAGEEAGAAEASTEAAVVPLCAVQEAKTRSVHLKVEMLVALVSKMEHLVSSAESVARTLQAGYHSEKFKVFPHINSPAALIKSIISSQQPAPGIK